MIRNTKKGQIQQVFIYILTIVVVGLVILFGYKSIGGLLKKGCDVEMSTFKSNIQSYLTKHTSYGEYHKEAIKAPCGYPKICFVSNSSIGKNILSIKDNTIRSSVKDGIEENIFLVKKELTEPAGYSGSIIVDNNILCLNNTNGKFYIAFEGLGKRVKIHSGLS